MNIRAAFVREASAESPLDIRATFPRKPPAKASRTSVWLPFVRSRLKLACAATACARFPRFAKPAGICGARPVVAGS